MSIKKLRRIICSVAIAGVAAVVPFFAGCSTDHPEAQVTIEFNDATYVLNYKLYRNMYPQTVQHFIELADNGFYQDTLIHHYQSNASYWYGGGYDYVTTAGSSYATAYEIGKDGLLDYLEVNSKEKQYSDLAAEGKLTPSVYLNYLNGEYSQPLNTLIGEFVSNQHKIENGALKSSFGALRMAYSQKDDDKIRETLKDGRVWLDKTGSQPGVQGEYKYNSATSLFSIQTSSSTSTENNYCIFATLTNTDVLTDLKTAVSKATPNSATTEVELNIDNYDEILGQKNNSTKYKLTKAPIIVRSVKITKY